MKCQSETFVSSEVRPTLIQNFQLFSQLSYETSTGLGRIIRSPFVVESFLSFDFPPQSLLCIVGSHFSDSVDFTDGDDVCQVQTLGIDCYPLRPKRNYRLQRPRMIRNTEDLRTTTCDLLLGKSLGVYIVRFQIFSKEQERHKIELIFKESGKKGGIKYNGILDSGNLYFVRKDVSGMMYFW